MTAAYMTRATYLTFFGKPRGAAAGEHHGDEHGSKSTTMAHVDEHDLGLPAHATSPKATTSRRCTTPTTPTPGRTSRRGGSPCRW